MRAIEVKQLVARGVLTYINRVAVRIGTDHDIEPRAIIIHVFDSRKSEPPVCHGMSLREQSLRQSGRHVVFPELDKETRRTYVLRPLSPEFHILQYPVHIQLLWMPCHGIGIHVVPLVAFRHAIAVVCDYLKNMIPQTNHDLYVADRVDMTCHERVRIVF